MLSNIKLVIIFIMIFKFSESFVPKKILASIIDRVDSELEFSLGYQSETLVHEEIIKRGIARSVARYFSEQPNPKTPINFSKLDTEYLDIKNIFRDYYGIYYCKIDIEKLISEEFQPNVASVDFDDSLKNEPSAHFDAEEFISSNNRVMQNIIVIDRLLLIKDYKRARESIAKILHTIQDFYSHSNWVEMGNRDINYNIGYANFSTLKFVEKYEANACIGNCTISSFDCTPVLHVIINFIQGLGFNTKFLNCPMRYYRCKGNLAIQDKLVSGYYGDQEDYRKPINLMKCSHGGILDSDSDLPSVGGINKDSGYYVFSPRADLHSAAANLAIKHTEHFFETIRKRIGNKEYEKFLSLRVSSSVLNQISNYIEICGAVTAFKAKLFNSSCMFIFWFFMIIFDHIKI